MGKPSAADMLAFQLEHAVSNQPHRRSPNPLSPPPSSSFGGSSTDSSAPPTPATPWNGGDYPTYGRKASSRPTASGLPGLGIAGGSGTSSEDDTASSLPQAPPRPKLVGRAARKQTEEEEEEPTDDELEDELNDFGYGARPRKRKEKKESLLDILNSEPPEWMSSPPAPLEPIEVVSAPQRSGTFGRKLRQRFGSSTGNSSSSDDPQAAFSTLRPSRSAGNLLSLGGLRKMGGNSHSSKRSLAGSVAGESASISRDDLTASLNGHGGKEDLDDFARLLPPVSAPVRKLSAKDATSSTSDSTRALADFLRSSAPPDEVPFHSPYPAPPSLPSSSSVDKENLSTSRNRSRSTLHKPRPSRSGESIDTMTTSTTTGTQHGNASILKAAMVKLGGPSGRRASLTPFSSGVVAPAPPSPAATQESEDGTGEIRIDESLLDGMFGVLAKPIPPRSSSSKSNGTSTSSKNRRQMSESAAVPAPQMDVRQFVQQDEAGQYGRFPSSAGAGPLPTVTRVGELPGVLAMVAATAVPPKSATSLTRSASLRSNGSYTMPLSPSRMTSPQRVSRKPVPSVINPIEELLADSSPSSPARKPLIKDETLAALLRLQERGETGPIAVGESPVKGIDASPPRPGSSERARGASVPYTSSPSFINPPAVSALDPKSPLSPIPSVYSTPPATPTPTTATVPTSANGTSNNKALKRLSLVAQQQHDTRPTSPPPEAPLPSPPTGAALPSRTRSRPSSVILGPASTPVSFGKAAHRLSLTPSFRRTGLGASSTGSQDSFVDPPLSAVLPPVMASPDAGSMRSSSSLSRLSGTDGALLEALEALRRSMRQTADLPLALSSSSEIGVQALVPTLKGIQKQMQLGADLIGAVLRQIEGEKREEREEGSEDGVVGVVEVLLVPNEQNSTSSNDGVRGKGKELEVDEAVEGEEGDEEKREDPAPTLDLSDLTSDEGHGFTSFVQEVSR
ncbi:hypothetical protein JCM8547_002371 [Rhodosporidiobolus lusitaniae]